MWVMVQYTLKPDQVEKHLALHEAVYEDLEKSQLPGLREATFALPDGVSFVSIMQADSLPVPGTEKLASFGAYAEGATERCVAPEVITPLREAGSYRFV